jgi:diguanylate cyclase (GGDEF)-like protein
MRRAGLACLMLWSFVLCLGSSPLWAWSLQRIDAPPAQLAQHLQATVDHHPGREIRHFYRLHARADDQDQRMLLVLERDRGQRLWLYSSTGALLGQLPLGSAPAPVSIGVRGAALPLDFPLPVREVWLVVDSVLGVHPRLRVETAERYYAHERDVWIYEIGLTAALAMLLLLSLAFSLILREPGYLAYVGFLLLMLAAIALRHPLAYRMAEAMNLVPERVAAIGVLVSTIAALAAVTLLRAASGIGSRYPRGSRAMQWVAIVGIVLGVINVLAIEAQFRIAQWAFNGINLSFGANAVLSAWLLGGTAWRGGRSARLFLLGWLPMVVVGAWFSIGSLVGLPQTPNPHRWVLFACMLQGIGWAVALGDRALSLQRERDLAWALAERDELTGLPNRRMLDRALADASSGWLLLCDLDEFKSVNDRHGHAFGDHCLVHFAQCLREALAGAAVFGRYGGEEFLAIVPDGDAEHARMLAERLRERTAGTPVQAHGLQHRLTVSIGIAPLDPVDSLIALANADRAMYRAKAAGRDRVEMG